jgi:hypothetical protein
MTLSARFLLMMRPEPVFALGLLGPAGKGVVIDVAGETQAAAENNAVAAVFSSDSFAQRLEHILYFHWIIRIR